MKTMSKALVGTIAAGAMALSSASPAFAQSRDYRHDRDGIDAGDIIAGALIIGGIAAVASAGSRDRGYDGDYRYDRAGYDDYGRGGYGGNPRQAIEQCVRAAEREASRRYGRADVTDVRDIDRTRYGFQVKGRIAVNTRGGDRYNDRRYSDSRDGRYGSGWGGDYRGWDNSMRGYDSGSFKCKYERGRIVDIDFGGIRGL
jgi:hypothetical protein